MEGDISKALAYQVKREIAQRYFGTRKLIEQDIAGLKDMITRINKRYENRFAMALIRVYSLLMDRDIINQFETLIGCKEPLFYDRYVNHSATIRKRLVHKLHPHGWLKKSKFINMVLDSYRLLYREYNAISELEAEAREELSIIREEIKIFRNKYSLDEIMSFIRNLDFQGQDMAKVMGSNVDVVDANDIERKIDIEDVDQIEKGLPFIPSMPDPDTAEPVLKRLAETIYARHPEITASVVSMVK